MWQQKDNFPEQGRTATSTLWVQMFLSGLGFYFLGLSVLIMTGNPNIFPTVAMIGSFLVPVTYVVFFYERKYISRLNFPVTAMAFIYGGILGLFAAALLEPLFVNRLDFFSSFEIGLIEEFAKIMGVAVIVRRRRHDSEMNGLILGAAVGMGFAALESNGYAFVAFIQSGGSLSVMVFVTMLRGLLSPIGHGTWTAILASVLFRESAAGRFIINHKVIGAYLTVAVLHGLWDGLPMALSKIFLPGLDIFFGQAFVGGIGLFILWRRWHEARKIQIEKQMGQEE